ncbi:Cysteine proteinase inhibitor 10 [Acorus gramineus]|uniref:Cysteine proteinase inhibitor 10 n=1 Tax=Acorus gramineus TaxID=55184 RepID=A0AAV9B670_ACOGR|nr:Cysteine proteinase inhibitor 10 [Acorus gramineus]
MANSNPRVLLCTTLTLSILFAIAASSSTVRLGGGLFGERTDVKDVKHKKEIQDLGRFSVTEYNANLAGRGLRVSFVEVVAAQRQVVSGFMYYLTVVATEGSVSKRFQAVVVLEASLKSKELVSFDPIE